MRTELHRICLGVLGVVVLSLAGCGSSDSPAPVVTPPAPATLSGTVATGAALANAGVAITDSNGASPCTETAITTSGLGAYTCTLKSGATAPFFIVVTDPTGNMAPLVSVSTTTPVAGTTLTVNATPLTTAILAQLATDGNPLTLVSGKTISAASLKTVTDNVVAQLATVLSSIGAPAGYNPFSTAISAATASSSGNTADLVLDVVKIVTDPVSGKPALATLDNPTPVVLATASSSGSVVSAPAAGLSTLSQAAQIASNAMVACFAVPLDQRVLAKDTSLTSAQGGPAVTNAASACADIVAESTNAAHVDFLHNGYNSGQFFYSLLTSSAMTGAKFSVPEIMAFYPGTDTASGSDEAVINIKYVDANGNPGNLITVARNIAGSTSASHPSTWWLVGNHHPVDVGVRLNIRRVEQLNAANTNQNKISTFQSGIQFNVNATGPGSIRSSNTLTLARISGPGLPGNGASGTGLVYKVSNESGQSSMDLFNKTGSLVSGSQCGNGVTFNCPNLWYMRTKGLSGSDAATLNTNQSGIAWVQTADVTAGANASKLVKGAKYKIELFYGSNTATADVTFNKTLLSDLIPATNGVNLPWHTLGAQSLSAFNPAGSLAIAQTALTVDWVVNPSAQQVSGVQAVVNTATGSFGPTMGVPKGATSAVLNNVTVPAFTTSTARTVLFGYRMLDSSNKTAVYTYN
jgi:hypothetical protein